MSSCPSASCDFWPPLDAYPPAAGLSASLRREAEQELEASRKETAAAQAKASRLTEQLASLHHEHEEQQAALTEESERVLAERQKTVDSMQRSLADAAKQAMVRESRANQLTIELEHLVSWGMGCLVRGA